MTTTVIAPLESVGPFVSAPATPPVRRPGARGSGGVRLTRRGRVVLLVLVLVLGAAALVLGAASVSAATGAESSPPVTVVVQPGQTLWGLAEQVAPERDPRDVVRAIAEANELPGSVVAPGQSLVIPAL